MKRSTKKGLLGVFCCVAGLLITPVPVIATLIGFLLISNGFLLVSDADKLRATEKKEGK